jgi:tetratricopeptide (TPR) repeat protein/transcriptional regulator with XRE-family HTH domain
VVSKPPRGFEGGSGSVADLAGRPFGEQLKIWRKRCGLTHADLVRAAEVGASTISELERGISTTPHRETVRLLADALALGGPERSDFEAAARAGALVGGAATTTRMLPRDLPSFTGRSRELDQILGAAGAPGEAPYVAVHVIEGLGGIGKTSLALHAAHRLAKHFPDGQLFLDLRGYTEGLDPMAALDALGFLLRRLGSPARLIPDDLDERAAFYRSQLAGSRTLIVLDNARNAAQVRLLLPGTPGCMVVVTSRKSLRGLDDVHPLQLDELPEQDALALFRKIARSVGEDDPALPEIIRLCARLPLAVRIAAEQMNHRRALSTHEILDRLRDEHRRLAHLQDEDRSIAATFELSYKDLSRAEQDAFQHLGLIPGPDFDAYAAASLIDTDLAAAGRLLDALLDHNLLASGLPGRYRFYDLVRVYVRTLNSPGNSAGESDPARTQASNTAAGDPAMLARLEDYYLHTAQEADRHLEHRIPPIAEPAVVTAPRTSPPLGTAERAGAWMSAELANLLAIAQDCAERRPGYPAALSAALAQHLRAQGPWSQAMSLHRLALAAASGIGDKPGAASALCNIGVMQRLAGALTLAGETLRQAADRYAEVGRCHSRAGVLVELGLTQRLTGAVTEAEETINQALDLYAQTDDRHGRAGGLAELGLIRRQKGDFTAARRFLETALSLYREVNSSYGRAGTLAYLGSVQLPAGDFLAAEETLEEGLGLYKDLGDALGQANCLLYLGCLRMETGEFPRAIATLTAARNLYAQFSDDRGEAGALAYLGTAQRNMGEYQEADGNLTQALVLFRKVGDKGGEAETLTHFAALALATGSPGQARTRYTDALGLARKIPSAKDEADALEGIGKTYLVEDRAEQARNYLDQAGEIYQKCDCPADAARVRAALQQIGGDQATS